MQKKGNTNPCVAVSTSGYGYYLRAESIKGPMETLSHRKSNHFTLRKKNTGKSEPCTLNNAIRRKYF